MKKYLKNIIVSGLVVSFFSGISVAETLPGTDLDVHFESANIIGTGRSINIHRVPVIQNGQKNYYDLSFTLGINDAGSPVLSMTSISVTPTLNSAENFIPGIYEDQNGTQYQVSGGGVSNGRVIWSIRSLTKNAEFNATWATGIPVNNPLIGGLNIAVSLINGPSYGILGSENLSGFCAGDLIGATQNGNSISISSYRGGCYDELSSAIYTLTITTSQ